MGQDVSSAQQEETPRSFNEPNPQTSGTHGNRNKPQESYEQLSILLAEKKWKEADWETMQILLRIAERTEQGWLLSIDEIPSEDIRKIDLLWLDASKGKFGYSVQKNIWLNVQGEIGVFDALVFYKFAKQVGWQVNDQLRMNYDDFDFSLNAPDGHLPTFRFPSDTDQLGTWLDAFKDFLPRL
ncbi:GUN4 domain-containing protein [Microcystis aeruginosa]|uniref:GUN4 domain-containing protein n=2 Tax=Microcystis aeruginosa TaxID=1126 RepID=A0A552DYZ7_MICAE|nr:GUN4 domain-containing protein [Microcystis aeruginosa]TRU27371.1 MAG: GUN4 domain-containing protein [Microcystis aeruginosa Ma_QC_B_20070730_S2]